MFAKIARSGVGIVGRFELSQVVEGQRPEVPGSRRWLINDNGQSHNGGAAGFEQRPHFAEIGAGAENIVHQHDAFAGRLLQKLTEAKWKAIVLAFGPIDLVRAQCFADAIGDGQPSGGGSDDRQL